MSALHDPLAETWAETIAALPSTPEREEATEFIRSHLREGAGTGILRGMFLLLKANRCYLEQLPAKFNRDLVQPLSTNFLRLETGIAQQIRGQDKITREIHRSADLAQEAAQRMEVIVPKVEDVVQSAFNQIDTQVLTEQITRTVVKSTVEPVAKTNHELNETLTALRELIVKMKEVIPVLKEVNLKGTLLGCFGLSFGLCSLIFILAWLELRASYHQTMDVQAEQLQADATALAKVQSTAARNQSAYNLLTNAQASLVVQPLTDAHGHVVDGKYLLVLDNAETAQVTATGQGVISFRGNDLASVLIQEWDQNRKLSDH